jgi:WD40 repeat protein
MFYNTSLKQPYTLYTTLTFPNLMPNHYTHPLFRILLITGLILLSACDRADEADKTWRLAPEGLFSAAISADGQYALLGSTSGKALLWNLKQRKKPLHAWQHKDDETGGIIAVALSPDHKYALTAERDSLAWWDTASGKTLGFWPIPEIYSLSISKDGKRALIGLRDQSFYFSLDKGTYIYTLPHTGMIYANDLSADGQYAITGSDENEVKLWSLASGKLKHAWKLSSKPYAVALSPNGKIALTNAASGATTLWKTRTGKMIHLLKPDRVTLTQATFSPNSKLLSTSRASQRIDLWKIKKGINIKHWQPKKAYSMRPSAASILALEFTHKGRRVMSVTSGGIVQRWKVK